MKISYIVYNSNGEILRTGYCSPSDLSNAANTGEFVMEGAADARTQKIVDGNIVSKTDVPIREASEDLKDTQARLRVYRNELLVECDWTQLADVSASMTAEEKTAWTTYRQALRDFPASNSTVSDFSTLNWPVSPEPEPDDLSE